MAVEDQPKKLCTGRHPRAAGIQIAEGMDSRFG